MKDVRWRSTEVHKRNVWNALDGKDTLIVFDTETTGLESDAKIIQFSAIKFALGPNKEMTELEVMDMLINPEEIVSSKIEELTGITNNMLRTQPNERMVYEKIFNFMAGADVWSGHNVGFDVEKLKGMAKRCHYNLEIPPVVDTLAMARNLMPKDDPKVIEASLAVSEETHVSKPNHKLATVTKFLFPDYKAKYHNSLEDVRATAKILGKMTEMYGELEKEAEGKKVGLKYAFFFVNPYKQSDQRIKVVLTDGTKSGLIYYDCMNHYWTCTSGAKDKEYFESVDKAYIEAQVINRFRWKFKAENMEDLVRAMRQDYNEKHGIGQKKEETVEEKKEVVDGQVTLEETAKAEPAKIEVPEVRRVTLPQSNLPKLNINIALDDTLDSFDGIDIL